jgi:hypothetical protein
MACKYSTYSRVGIHTAASPSQAVSNSLLTGLEIAEKMTFFFASEWRVSSDIDFERSGCMVNDDGVEYKGFGFSLLMLSYACG